MGRFKEVWSDDSVGQELDWMLNKEILFQLERIEDLIAVKIDRARYYNEPPNEGTLVSILEDIKEVRKRYS